MDSHSTHSESNIDQIIENLKHFLPAQAPLKDFVHHNTLHAFQQYPFFKALHRASNIFGYKVSLTLQEYRHEYRIRHISEKIIDRIVIEKFGSEQLETWKHRLLKKKYDTWIHPRIGHLRDHWNKQYRIDLDTKVHPILFRVLCSYLDQGISIWKFPVSSKGFLASVKELEKNSLSSFFKNGISRDLLFNTDCKIEDLLKILVGDEKLYTNYLFDQQFAHQGWSGMIAAIEHQPDSLLDRRTVTLKDVITFELLLEIDALNVSLDGKFVPLAFKLKHPPVYILDEVEESELDEVLSLWQEAYEWSYYNQVLAGLNAQKHEPEKPHYTSFQAMFCIDDREGSLRRYLEKEDAHCETFGTPGFFGVEFYFQPEDAKSYSKLCPAPVQPQYLIKEISTGKKRKKDIFYTKKTHSLLTGWFMSQTLGMMSSFRLFMSIFKPTLTEASASSLRHMGKDSKLTILNKDKQHRENGLQIGFTPEEMAVRIESLLKSIGLVKDFAPIVYVIGHGSSTSNNPHYAAYDCGACCGRPGSVNAKVAAAMANNEEVRKILAQKGIEIPDSTQFIGGLHDTTRDEIVFFDEQKLTKYNHFLHYDRYKAIFKKALDKNAKERSRRFESIDLRMSPEKIHEKVKLRSVSLFEPRPELNHATNALCVIGRRALTKGLFLDRRSFMNSYDYRHDPTGKFLLPIIKAAAPVCGGINLEYFFSRVDNQKLGAGTKLPHNVMGLFGVANGIDGDLRPGLPSQMIELHDPVRLMMIIEHFPDIVLNTIKIQPETYEWFKNEWIHLVVVNPVTNELFQLKNEEFKPYQILDVSVEKASNLENIIETHRENLPVYSI